MAPRVTHVMPLMFLGAMLVGGFSLARINPEYESWGIFGEARYWLAYGLMLVMCGRIPTWKRVAVHGHVWLWILVVVGLHGYVALSALWSHNFGDSSGELLDIILLIVLLIMAVFAFAKSPELSIEFLLKALFWVSLVFTMTGILIYRDIAGEMYELGAGGIGLSRLHGGGIIAALYLWTKTKGKYWLLPIPLWLLSVFLSGSAAAVLALFMVVFVFLPVSLKVSKKAKLGAAFFLFVVSVGFFLLPFARGGLELFWAKMWIGGSPEVLGIGGLYLADRDEIFFKTWQMFLEHPVWGIGFGTYKQIASESYPHNLTLNIAVDSGIIGLLLFSVALLFLVYRWFHRRMLEHNVALCVAIFHFVASMFAGTYYDARFMWFFLLLYMLPVTSEKIRDRRSATLNMNPAR